MRRSEKGFSLTELIIVVGMVFIFVICFALIAAVISLVAAGNCCYTESGVLQELKIDHPEVTEILRTERNIWNYSVIEVRNGGEKEVFLLDTDVFFNYRLLRFELD